MVISRPLSPTPSSNSYIFKLFHVLEFSVIFSLNIKSLLQLKKYLKFTNWVLYQWGNGTSERASDLPKATQQIQWKKWNSDPGHLEKALYITCVRDMGVLGVGRDLRHTQSTQVLTAGSPRIPLLQPTWAYVTFPRPWPSPLTNTHGPLQFSFFLLSEAMLCLPEPAVHPFTKFLQHSEL